jgi:predicted permease
LTESLLLAGLGGALGLLLARWFRELLIAFATNSVQQPISVQTDARVLAFTAAVALLTGILFGLAPALTATRLNLTSALKEGGASGRVGASRSLLTKGLVSVQVALSLLLLIGAGLFLRTLMELERVPLGFSRERMLMFSVAPGLNGYDETRLAEYYRQMQSRIDAVPGVSSASFSGHGPIGGGASVSNVSIPGVTSPGQDVDVHRNVIGPDYFSTLGLSVLEGRVLGERDDSAAPKVAVINQALVRKAFGETRPIGKVLRFGRKENPQDFEIVGVVADAAYNNVRTAPPPTAYLSYLQAPEGAGFMTFEVRTTGDPDSVVAALREAAAAVDQNVPLKRIETLATAVDRTLMIERMFSRLTALFGLLALVLVCVGLYGTMSYFVARQTSEIGIRMALGAQPGRVFRMVLAQGLKITGVGVVVGLAGAVAATRLIESVLYNVRPVDALTFSSVSLLLILVCMLACYLPARRATRVDPMVALRSE